MTCSSGRGCGAAAQRRSGAARGPFMAVSRRLRAGLLSPSAKKLVCWPGGSWTARHNRRRRSKGGGAGDTDGLGGTYVSAFASRSTSSGATLLCCDPSVMPPMMAVEYANDEASGCCGDDAVPRYDLRRRRRRHSSLSSPVDRTLCERSAHQVMFDPRLTTVLWPRDFTEYCGRGGWVKPRKPLKLCSTSDYSPKIR